MPLTNLNGVKPIVDADIPAVIARDVEVTSAIASHVALTDPHPNLWTRITNAFLVLTGGQTITKNNPAMSAASFIGGQNHFECRTNDGSNPIIGFHRAGVSATALYHLGYGDNSLRIRNADGFDGAIVHDGNIGLKNAGSVGGVKMAVVTGVLPSAAGGTVDIALPTIVTALNVIGITGIATINVGNIIRNIPPVVPTIASGTATWYSIHAVSGFPVGNSPVSVRLTLGTAIESQSIFGAQVRIFVSYL